MLQHSYLIGIGLVFLSMTIAGVYSARKVKSAEDFSVGGRKATAWLVAGSLMGTMIGGASTIGTAQVAFRFGLSAWWWCLGAGIGFVVLASGLGRRLYETGVSTVPQILARSYGDRIRPIVAVFTSLGIFFSFIGNSLAFVALCSSTLHMRPITSALLGTVLMLVYVMFGGVWGTGLGGILKVALVYISLLCCGVVAWQKVGGLSGLTTTFPPYPWFSLFGRGISVDFAAGFSMLLGVLSTQSYFQAVASAKDVKAARSGSLISALLTPLIGLGAVLVGLCMKAQFPATPSAEAMPAFALKFLPPMLSGVVLATLLVTIVGCSAGLALGISTMFAVDIYKQHLRTAARGREILRVQRVALLLTSLVPLYFVTANNGASILDWSFLSMGLRGCTVLFPLLGALFFPQYVSQKAGIAAACLGPLTCFLWHVALPKGLDPLYPGLAVSFLALVAISIFSPRSFGELSATSELVEREPGLVEK
ncbi:MAG TPA: sodium:solute symporter family protein [candidate division Zixibacteria bacterium]|nr:sodium:solute symporter family protein [candidate division Zixibacteria bacterium]